MTRTNPRTTHPGHHEAHSQQEAHSQYEAHSEADRQAEILDLDAAVIDEHTAAIAGWLPLRTPPIRIVDIGCGTGAGTFALLDRFPEAHVTAVDASAGHLRRLREKACARGLDGRVHAVQADLDRAAWPDLGTPDLVWASASMHHMAHPDHVLRNIRELLAHQGLFAVVELAAFPRFLPEDAPEDRPGLEERCHQASDRLHAAHVPHRGADWGPMLTRAGFTVEGERTIAVTIEGSANEAVGTYALSSLRRLRHSVAGALAPEDLSAFDRLLDTDSPHCVLRRDDLAVRTERTVWAARRAD